MTNSAFLKNLLQAAAHAISIDAWPCEKPNDLQRQRLRRRLEAKMGRVIIGRAVLCYADIIFGIFKYE